MGFYDLPKKERIQLVNTIDQEIKDALSLDESKVLRRYFSDEDTYIRKTAYLALGKIYKTNDNLQNTIIQILRELFVTDNSKVRQTVVNAAGEIGKGDFSVVVYFFDKGLLDSHHSVRNAVIGSVKKMGEKNPAPILKWAKPYLYHSDKEIRREVCHGLELRGRTHPQDILPLLQVLQDDTTSRVRNTLIHVIGQIAYKEGCLKTVIAALNTWENKELVAEALDEIVDVHRRYKSFAILTEEEAIAYIDKNYMQ